MWKIFEDTLKNNGKWSRKSLMLVISFGVTMALGIFIVVSDYILKTEINRHAIDVFETLIFFVAAQTGFTVADKKFTNKITGEE